VKQVLIQGGSARVEEVPAPAVSAKNVLVRVEYSCISTGTELTGVKLSGMPLYRRALKQPEHVRRVLEMARDQGLRRTANKVLGRLAAGSPTGYSAAGTVVDIGREVQLFRVGDKVACAGAGVANHAELIDVPVNLAVKVPNNVGMDFASTVTLGAIALQGIRRAQPTLGETVAVIGLGLLGQLTVQMLHANGCRVIGSDLDSHRVAVAKESGVDWGLNPAEEDFVHRVNMVTDGWGADAVIITAATPSHEVIRQAMKACRKKGKVILVGDVGLNLQRSDFYAKELDFLISTSYGPGRYDTSYEEAGIDYPLAYVRWTENRNMEAYLQLLAERQVSLQNLGLVMYSIEEAPRAYETLREHKEKPLIVLLSYPNTANKLDRKVILRSQPKLKNRISVGLVGAGSFAQGVHLPNLIKLRRHFELRGVMSRTGATAKAVASRYEASYATTDIDELLNDSDLDLVMISTRHDLHGQQVLRCLQAKKHVFVEKPLALVQTELDAIERFYATTVDGPLLLTGFNRRFAPGLQRIRAILADRTTPLIVNYRMNAGYIPLDHWVHGSEGGGRNIGEACHIYDLFNFLANAEVASVHAASISPPNSRWAKNDNFVATTSYNDGSVATLTYTAMGDRAHPKERMDIYADGKVVSMDDYKSVTITGSKQKGWRSAIIQKGHLEELDALAAALKGGSTWPISLAQQVQATRISFLVENAIRAGSA
jgi:predicted dehydrogenase/threonine dehydrogenase-like Zn-dependent dehydrogenase